VGLAAFAAAGISGGDPIRTGIQGFTYDIRTAILPFMFIFNTELLMIGIRSWYHLVIVVVTAVIAMLAFAAATQGYFLTRSRFYETIALLLVTFILFRPGYFWDKFYPPFVEKPGIELVEIVETMDPGSMLRLRIKGETMRGKEFTKSLMLTVGSAQTGLQRLEEIGIELREEEGKVLVDNVVFGSKAEKIGIDFDQEILLVKMLSKRPPKQFMFFPALGLFALIYWLQKRRRDGTATV
jgi:hypothetical protein